MINKNITFYFIILSLFFFYPLSSYAAVPDDKSSSPVNATDLTDYQSQPSMISEPVISSGSIKIPDSIVALSSGYIIVVDKRKQRIYVFHKAEKFSKVFEAPCSTGKNPGSKQEEGDARTPNGIFFTTKIIHNPGPPETYGSMAFPLDYPTLVDQRAGKNGKNIWIHGTTKSLLPKQSSGCVVLRDGDLKRLANFIFLNRTPVIISESIKWVSPNYVSSSRDELEKILISWNRAFVEKDLNKIDALYMQGTEIKGKRREELHDKIKNLKFLNKHFFLAPRDISILQEDNNAVIVFDQIFSVNNNSFQGFYNKLILERINNRWYVVDDATPSRVDRQLALAKGRQVESGSADDNDQKEIRNLVKTWLLSWRTGDMETYGKCYSSDFQSRGMDLNAWIEHKTKVHQNSRNINIRIENLRISGGEDRASVSFKQTYSSSALRSKGKKTLELKKTGDEWKIYREIM